ncbi:MAG: hypothetical protein CMN28_12930 [Salinisphaeraceae bacterium]|nr:hypothetical protein [Salinisphaeraceae bacterium]
MPSLIRRMSTAAWLPGAPGRRRRAISTRMHAAVMGISSLVILMTTLAFLSYEWYLVRISMQRDLTVLAEVLAGNSTAPVVFGDAEAAAEVLRSLKAKPNVLGACLDTAGSTAAPAGVLARYARAGADFSCDARSRQADELFADNLLQVTVPVVVGEETVGHLTIAKTLDELWERLFVYLRIAVVILFVGLLIAFALTRVSQRLITRGITRLAQATQAVSASRDYRLRLDKESDDEVGDLIDNFNTMLEQIRIRDEALEAIRADLLREVAERTRANNEMETALVELRDLQTQLVQNEKMASLGGLVAGVAHEINTPVGISVTAASTLREKAVELREVYQSGRINRSKLDAFVDTADQSSAIILSNLTRSAELIQSFKQVAVDQSSSERRMFDMHDSLQETLLSLWPKYKQGPHRVELDCPENLRIDGFPGALSQILTNLLLNSLTHAYAPGQAGVMRIDVSATADRVSLRYSDDGAGMEETVRQRIFDPFFTTRRGRGGSGLGMHIVYNLVTNTLRGRIQVDSRPGEGARVNIDFPRHPFEREADAR